MLYTSDIELIPYIYISITGFLIFGCKSIKSGPLPSVFRTMRADLKIQNGGKRLADQRRLSPLPQISKMRDLDWMTQNVG